MKPKVSARRPYFLIIGLLLVIVAIGLLLTPTRTPKRTPIPPNSCAWEAALSCDYKKLIECADETSDFNVRDDNGNTLLHYAAGTMLHQSIPNECLGTVIYLVEKGADVNAWDSSGRTPLHLAAENALFYTVYYLVENDADVSAVDNAGKKPVDYASREDAVKFLACMEGTGCLIPIETKSRLYAIKGDTLTNIGAVYEAQGRYTEALDTYQQALSSVREVGDRVREGRILINIGAVYEAQGRYAEALQKFQEALVCYRESGDRAGEGATIGYIGAAYNSLGQYEEALDYLEQALAIQREIGDIAGEGNTLNEIGTVYSSLEWYEEALGIFEQALAIQQEIGDRAREGTTLGNVGLIYDRLGQYKEALNYYQQALVIQREIGDRAGEGRLLTSIGFIHETLGRYGEALASYQQAMDILETIRIGAGVEEYRAAFASEYTTLYDHAASLFHRQGQDEAAFFTSERGRTRAYLDSLSTGLVEMIADEAATLKLADVQSSLNEKTTVVSYDILDDQTLAYLITRKDFKLVVLEITRQELTNRVWYFRNVIPSLQPEATHLAAQELYQLLIGPISTSLHTSHLAVVPEGPLHYLPFAALVDDTGQYFLERYTLVTLPSASTLPFVQVNASDMLGIGADSPSGSSLILGNPVTRDPNLAPLPFAEQEAQAIATLYNVQPLLGEAATESAVREGASRANILHLAAHGSYNITNPLFSTVYLAPDGDASNDGRLEVREVYGLDLHNTDLVVLSACKTQLGELSAGDELVGLTRAFFFAGTPTVVATLWSVDDEATALLMEHFYSHLQEGMGKAEALRQAQLDMQADPEHPWWAHPYYWSGFVLTGDGSEMPSRTSGWAWLLVAGGVVVAIAVVVLWRRAMHRYS